MEALLSVRGGLTPYWLLVAVAFLAALLLAWAPGGRKGLAAGGFVLVGALILGRAFFDPQSAEIALPVEGGWTPYGLLMAYGVLAGLILTRAMFGPGALKAGIAATIAGLLVGHVTWGLVMAGFLDSFVEPGWLFFLQPWLGGNTLYGAVFGALLGVLLYHLATRKAGRGSFLLLLDSLTPGACLALAAGRVAELFNGQGIGPEMENPALQRFPFAVCTYAEEDYAFWQVCVWFWEALAALALFVALLFLIIRAKRRREPLSEGRLTGIFIIVLACSQIFLEQLRQDDCLRFGFVISFTQIAAAVTLAGALLVRAIRRKGLSGKDFMRIGVVAAGLLTVIFCEFVFDKPQFYTALSIALLAQMALGAALLFWAPTKKSYAWRIPCALLLLGCGAAVTLLLGKLDVDIEMVLIYAVMALSLTVTATASLRFCRRDERLFIAAGRSEEAVQ